MRFACAWLLMAASLVPAARTNARTGVPPRWDDLPKRAATWPPAWGALVRDVMAADDFETQVLDRVGALLSAEKATPEAYTLADTVLSAALRHHQSVRRAAPWADDPAQALHAQL